MTSSLLLGSAGQVVLLSDFPNLEQAQPATHSQLTRAYRLSCAAWFKRPPGTDLTGRQGPQASDKQMAAQTCRASCGMTDWPTCNALAFAGMV